MVPLRLTLKNFLSYQSVTLEFRGLHTACICGPNGAGKSSLLEGISWALWGESRVATEEDVIHLGAKEAQVDYWFELHQQTYRVLRTRIRGQTTVLEFQVLTDNGLKSLTGRGVRATQDLILQHLKLDYETFINSAYLRQGRADEFMTKRPSERKQILTDLLKLDHYDDLAEQAKDYAKTYRAKVDLLHQSLVAIANQLVPQAEIVTQQAALGAEIDQLRQEQVDLQQEIQTFQTIQQQRRTWEQELQWQQQQHQANQVEQRQLEHAYQQALEQQASSNHILQQAAAIGEGYANWQQLQQAEEAQGQRFETYQHLQDELQAKLQLQTQEVHRLREQQQQVEVQRQGDQQQAAELQPIVAKAPEIDAAIAQLQQAKATLAHWDAIQIQALPLQQRHRDLQAEIDRAQTKLVARIEELNQQIQTLQTQQQQRPELIATIETITAQIEALDKRRIYHQRVREKGQERRTFMEQLETRIKEYEQQLQALETKLQMPPVAGSLCPLCDSPLDEQHWQQVRQKQRAEQQELRDQIWVVKEQLTVSDREIKVLRQEYREVEQELAPYGSLLEQRGQLQAQLQAITEGEQRRQVLDQERAERSQQLATHQYADKLHQERAELADTLQSLQYDERTHALSRGDVERWRWAEIRHSELRKAQRKLQDIQERQPQLDQQYEALQAKIDQILGQGSYQQHPAPIHQAILGLQQQLRDLNYDPAHHNTLRSQVRQTQVWQWRYQELQHAQQQAPQIQEQINQLVRSQQHHHQAQQEISAALHTLTEQLNATPDPAPKLAILEERFQIQRQLLDTRLAEQGRLQQQIFQLEQLKRQEQKQQAELKDCQYQLRIYQELGQAFGKNGIQALMIENVLPQIEAEANHILNRLSGNQLHIQFVTQKASRRDQRRRKRKHAEPTKMIDTLDILIADLSGTRPYETYSGGEAFRVNFAIRLALARLLAQRSGTALQMLIIDEGFGTQDPEGCDRLIASINAIAPDFACILVVTHMPHFKAAFQSRIEVSKTAEGSQLTPIL